MPSAISQLDIGISWYACSHSHLRLQLPQLLFLVVLLDYSCGGLAGEICHGCLGQLADLVADGDVACIEHLLVELFLLEFCEFFVKLVFVDAVVGDTRCNGFVDFFADGVLFAEAFPVGVR